MSKTIQYLVVLLVMVSSQHILWYIPNTKGIKNNCCKFLILADKFYFHYHAAPNCFLGDNSPSTDDKTKSRQTVDDLLSL